MRIAPCCLAAATGPGRHGNAGLEALVGIARAGQPKLALMRSSCAGTGYALRPSARVCAPAICRAVSRSVPGSGMLEPRRRCASKPSLPARPGSEATNSCSTRSPMGWPRVSLIFRKSQMSMVIRLSARPVAAACRIQQPAFPVAAPAGDAGQTVGPGLALRSLPSERAYSSVWCSEPMMCRRAVGLLPGDASRSSSADAGGRWNIRSATRRRGAGRVAGIFRSRRQ